MRPQLLNLLYKKFIFDSDRKLVFLIEALDYFFQASKASLYQPFFVLNFGNQVTALAFWLSIS